MAVTIIDSHYVGDGLNNQIDTTAYANASAVGLGGNDRIFSSNSSNNNVLEGNQGADNLFFASGATGHAGGTLYGGGGNDLLSGSFATDQIYGGEGDDAIVGNWESDTSNDADVLYGGSGRDSLNGGGGNDVIYGGEGNEFGSIQTASPTTVEDNLLNNGSFAGLFGGAGDDHLDGGAGDDLLSGGTGRDTLTGGTGADLFRFESPLGGGNVDRIRDFSHSEGDTILLGREIFSSIGNSLSKKELAIGRKAKDGNDFVIYDERKGTLAYDEDGKGGHKAVVFATVEKGLKLSHHDFDVDLSP